MKDLVRRIKTAIASGILFLGAYLFSSYLFSFFLLVVGVMILLFEWPRLSRQNKMLWYLVPIYPILPLACLIYLNHTYRAIDILLPLYPFLVSWFADTGGYLMGNLCGKHKICPSISPKKSWEGLGGAFLGVFLINKILITTSPSFKLFGLSNNYFSLALYSGLLTVVAFFGDLFESFLKRRAGVKDSGSLLPGHGGLLDRLDSVFFVVIVVVLRSLIE